jgi:pimeloyl-ACP methyl ester carboxylesterase
MKTIFSIWQSLLPPVCAILAVCLYGPAACSAAAEHTMAASCYATIDHSDCRHVQRDYTAPDGSILGYIAFQHPARRPRTAIIYLNGIESHAAWFETPGFLLCDTGYDVFCLDRRGSGINRENRGFMSGHIDNYETLLDDIDAFVATIRPLYDRLFIVGMSWGGKLGLAYCLTQRGRIDGLGLITPGLCTHIDLGFFAKIKVLFGSFLFPRSTLRLPIEDAMFTRTPRFLECIGSDALRLHDYTARFLMQSRRLDRFVEKKLGGNRTPLLLFLAGHDVIIDNNCVRALLERGASAGMRTLIYEDQRHSLQLDAPERFVSDLHEWITGLPATSGNHRESGS